MFKAVNVVNIIYNADVENYVERNCNADKVRTTESINSFLGEKVNNV
jgi:hypothetical protein